MADAEAAAEAVSALVHNFPLWLTLGSALLLAACSTTPPLEMTHPASRHCVQQGGGHSVENDGLGEFLVCQFAENRQCEEWALVRGECPRGGVDVSAYDTKLERYCGIRGGRMSEGVCVLPPAGMYEAKLSSMSVTLLLDMQHGAILTRTLPGPAVVPPARGQWERRGDEMTVITGSDRIVFRYQGDRLVARQWDYKVWGDAGPGTLKRQ